MHWNGLIVEGGYVLKYDTHTNEKNISPTKHHNVNYDEVVRIKCGDKVCARAHQLIQFSQSCFHQKYACNKVLKITSSNKRGI